MIDEIRVEGGRNEGDLWLKAKFGRVELDVADTFGGAQIRLTPAQVLRIRNWLTTWLEGDRE